MFLPTSSTSWRCFSSSFFRKWVRRSFLIAASLHDCKNTAPARRGSRGRYHAPRANSIPGAHSALDGEYRRIAPEALEPVEGARLLAEDVRDHVAVVEEEPARLRGPFAVAHADALRAQGDCDRLRDRIHLGGGAAGAHQEEVGEGGHALEIEDDEVDGPLGEGGVGGEPHHRLGGAGGHAGSRERPCSPMCGTTAR